MLLYTVYRRRDEVESYHKPYFHGTDLRADHGTDQGRSDRGDADCRGCTSLGACTVQRTEDQCSYSKKAYDSLEAEGLVVTVHGKGSFIANTNQELLMEERRKELEKELEEAVRKARVGGLTAKEIRESFEIIMELLV